jgi:predicted transcriptional regulator
MRNITDLHALSDDDLLARLSRLARQSRHVTADLVAHIGEVDRRRLFAREATSSMFGYCTEVLHLSEHAAYLRIAVARAARSYPVLLEMLRDGRLHLTAIRHIAPLLLDAADDATREEILRCATHKSKREVEELVARLKPQPDAPTSIRKLPKRRKACSAKPESELGPDRVGAPSILVPSQAPGEAENEATPPSVRSREPAQPTDDGQDSAPESGPVVRVLATSSARYKVTFTISAECRDKLQRLKELTRSSRHGGDLAAIIEEAVTEKLERVEARRLGKLKSPASDIGAADTSAGSRHIPAAVRRVVSARDADRCTFVNTAGKRCSERAGLEFHHDQPFALGGDRSASNIRLACKTHNALFAEETYGTQAIDRHRSRAGMPPQGDRTAGLFASVDRAPG